MHESQAKGLPKILHNARNVNGVFTVVVRFGNFYFLISNKYSTQRQYRRKRFIVYLLEI